MLSTTEIKNIKDARKAFRTEYAQRIHDSLESKIDELVQHALQNGETRVQINVSTLYNHIDKYQNSIILGIKEDYEVPDTTDDDEFLTEKQKKAYALAVVDLAESDQKTQDSILPFRKESVRIAMEDYAQNVPLPANVEGYNVTITL